MHTVEGQQYRLGCSLVGPLVAAGATRWTGVAPINYVYYGNVSVSGVAQVELNLDEPTTPSLVVTFQGATRTLTPMPAVGQSLVNGGSIPSGSSLLWFSENPAAATIGGSVWNLSACGWIVVVNVQDIEATTQPVVPDSEPERAVNDWLTALLDDAGGESAAITDEVTGLGGEGLASLAETGQGTLGGDMGITGPGQYVTAVSAWAAVRGALTKVGVNADYLYIIPRVGNAVNPGTYDDIAAQVDWVLQRPTIAPIRKIFTAIGTVLLCLRAVSFAVSMTLWAFGARDSERAALATGDFT